MSSELYQKGEHPDGVKAICPECERVVLKDTESKATDVVDSHNKQIHGGKEVAGICAWDVPSITEMIPDPSKNFSAFMQLGSIINDMSKEEMKAEFKHRQRRSDTSDV